MSLNVNIKKTLGNFKLDVNFDTDKEVLGILGASGCGKSLTLKCIAGIDTPDSGTIILNGVILFDSSKRINLAPQMRKVGYLFQNYALFPNMTVKKNIMCGLKYQKDNSLRDSLYSSMIDMLQLHGLENHNPSQLSGGQAQRVALARILVNQPDILMLDEPFSALDSHLRDKLQIELHELLKTFKKEVLLVTHSRDEAYHLSNSIAVMDAGRFLALKPTKDLFSNPESKKAAMLTGCKNIVDAQKTGEYSVYVPSWGITLTTSLPIRNELCAIGIRAHYFNAKTPQNRYAIKYFDELESPFEWILQFKYTNQTDDSDEIWWRIYKDRKPSSIPESLGIAPINVLPLYS